MEPRLAVRPIRPADAGPLAAFYESLGPDARYLRFHGLCHLSSASCAGFCSADGQVRAGFVALLGEVIVGHACLEPVGPGRAELGIAVADHLLRQGIGSALLGEIEAWARTHGVRSICADVLATNGPMAALMARLGPVRAGPGGDLAEPELEVALV